MKALLRKLLLGCVRGIMEDVKNAGSLLVLNEAKKEDLVNEMHSLPPWKGSTGNEYGAATNSCVIYLFNQNTHSNTMTTISLRSLIRVVHELCVHV